MYVSIAESNRQIKSMAGLVSRSILSSTGSFHLGVSVSDEATPFYAELVCLLRAGAFEPDRLHTWALYELDVDDPYRDDRSVARYLGDNLWGPLGLRLDHCHFPTSAGLKEYERNFKRASGQGLDFLLLDYAGNGQVGLLEYGETLQVAAHVRTINDGPSVGQFPTLRAPYAEPLSAVTVGVDSILSAKRIGILAFGEEKAWGVMIDQLQSDRRDTPFSRLFDHPDVVMGVDVEAASMLSGRQRDPITHLG